MFRKFTIYAVIFVYINTSIPSITFINKSKFHSMATIRTLYWILVFLIRLQFLSDSSVATMSVL
jgi:hypothetical protein